MLLSKTESIEFIKETLLDDIDSALDIDSSSIHSLIEEMRTHSKKASKYQRAAAIASHLVNNISLELRVITAEIVDGIYKEYERNGRPLAQTARGEIRKTKVPLDERYKSKVEELNEAKEAKDILQGYVYSFVERGRRIKEILNVIKNTNYSPRIFVNNEEDSRRLSTRLRDNENNIEY